jgi:ribosome biogenesis protein Tsr3
MRFWRFSLGGTHFLSLTKILDSYTQAKDSAEIVQMQKQLFAGKRSE